MSYPSVFLLKVDKPAVPYRGPRRAAAYVTPIYQPPNHWLISTYSLPHLPNSMLHFVSRSARPAVTESLDATGLAALKTADETVFVAFLDPSDRESAALFEDVARRYREEFSFGSVVDASVAEAQGVEVPAVVCYKLVDGDVVAFKGFEGDEGLDEWYVWMGSSFLGWLW
jgi:protein disulfide-isomerase A1